MPERVGSLLPEVVVIGVFGTVETAKDPRAARRIGVDSRWSG